MFGRIGQFVVRRAWLVIAAWIIVAGAVLTLSPKLTTSSNETSFLPPSYESIQATNLQAKAFPNAFTPSSVIVFTRSNGGPLTVGDEAKCIEVVGQVKNAHIRLIQKILIGPLSPNRLVQTAGIEMPLGNPADPAYMDAIQQVRDQLARDTTGTGITARVTGQVATQLDKYDAALRAEKIIGIATVALIVVLLLLIFRSPIIALLPILVIGLVRQVATGLVADASAWFNLQLDSSITSLLIVVLFGIGTDYILFLIYRYRERLRAGDDAKSAMVSAVTRVGEAIASAAGAVIIAFLALLLSSLGMLRSLGPALAIAVAVTLLAGLTLVPAVVSLLGARVFWPSNSWKREARGTHFPSIGLAVGRRPGVFAAASALLMIALSAGALAYTADFNMSASSTPKDKESVVAVKELRKGFPAGAISPTYVYLKSTDGSTLDKTELSRYRQQLQAVPGVGTVDAPVLSTTEATASYTLVLASDPQSDTAMSTVERVRATAHEDAPPGSEALVGGMTAVYVDIDAAMARDYSIVFPVAALLIMVILGLLLRSLVAPWYLLGSVALGFGATLGATSLAFQVFGNQPGLMFTLPLIMYLFVVALGTDYNILMVARLREEAIGGLEPRQAARAAIRFSGPTIASAGAILAGTFASMMLAGNLLMTEMGSPSPSASSSPHSSWRCSSPRA